MERAKVLRTSSTFEKVHQLSHRVGLSAFPSLLVPLPADSGPFPPKEGGSVRLRAGAPCLLTRPAMDFHGKEGLEGSTPSVGSQADVAQLKSITLVA